MDLELAARGCQGAGWQGETRAGRGGPSATPDGDAAGRAGGWRGSARPSVWISTEEDRPRCCGPSRRTGRVYAPCGLGLGGGLSAKPRPSGSSPRPPRRASRSRAAPTLSRVIAPPFFRAASPPRVASGLCLLARARSAARPPSQRALGRPTTRDPHAPD